MNAHMIPARVSRGLILIRDQANKLDNGSFSPNSYEAHVALKTIKDECEHLRQYIGMLTELNRLVEQESVLR
jgi:hypothetical protein